MQKKERTKSSIDFFAEQLSKPEAVLLWQYLDENPSAKQMLTGLYQAGCDPLTLMTLAVLYCKGEELGVTEIAKLRACTFWNSAGPRTAGSRPSWNWLPRG